MMRPEQTRVIKVGIPKSLESIHKCRQCKGGKADQIVHIHVEDMVKYFSGEYPWQVRPEMRKKYEAPIRWAMKQRWYKEGLEPIDLGEGKDTLFSDGKDEFAAVSLCKQKTGFVRKALELGLPKLSPEQAREILTKSIQDEWEFNPVAG